MCGTGEYTTGYVHDHPSASDKRIGVVALTCFDLRRRLLLGPRLLLVGTSGHKLPHIRDYMHRNITQAYNGLDSSCESFPDDSVQRNPLAYRDALDQLKPGDVTIIFTPDDTHLEIALYAIERKIHVLITKPPVKTIEDHRKIMDLAKKNGVLVMVEYHKRFDYIYRDARDRITKLGDCNYFQSFMSQPKLQLDTFKAWAGKSSDISYYLNSHHIDIHCWGMQGIAKPVSVMAMGSTGIAHGSPFDCPQGTEDTISLMTHWQNISSGNMGVGVYTASWAASNKADVHSQQRFNYIGAKGEVAVDQAHRGYTVAHDEDGFRSVNPLYMAYMPDEDGNFNGQHGYGYKSIECFVENAKKVNSGNLSIEQLNKRIPTIEATLLTTAILEAGRISLDEKRPVELLYDGDGNIKGLK
eukprot:Nk52_evm2s346 gene=Nk52_evmTU2s346